MTKGKKILVRIRYPDIREADFKRNIMIDEAFKVLSNKRGVNGFYVEDEGVFVTKYYNMEHESVAKIFINPDNRKLTSNLSGSASKLYLWIIHELDYGKDYLWINKIRYMKENHIKSVKTYRLALRELIRYMFIAESKVRGVYWINPRLFFCGSRIKKYPERVQERAIC